jgi:subtilisin family serine protease
MRTRFSIDVLEARYLLSAALDLIGVNAMRADPNFSSIDGSGVSVAIIDTGVDFTHPLLQSAQIAAHDFVRDNNQALPTDEHGTHVAGIVGARDPDIGVATGVGLIGLQVFTPTQSGKVLAYDSDTEQALQWVLDHRVEFNIVAVNMSLGSGNFTSAGQANSSILFDDVQRLQNAGVTVVAAAGNSYGALQTAGSAEPGVFSTLDVGAVYETNEGQVSGGDGTDFTTAADRITFFSQRPDTSNELFAPGAFINSTVPGGGFKSLAGTSMASPMVTGVVALMQDAAQTFGGRLLTPDEVQSILRNTADTIVDGDDENTSVTTTGGMYQRVNAYKAVQFIRNEFIGGGTTLTDPNGTLSGAISGPVVSSTTDSFAGTIGTDGSTQIGGKDVDLYRFTVTSPGDVTLTLASSDFQPNIRLFAENGTSLGSNTTPVTTTLTVNLGPGTYFAGVSSAPNNAYNPAQAGSGQDGGTGDYTVSFDQALTDADGVLAAATPINLTSGDVPQALDVSIGQDDNTTVGGGDVDFFEITVPDTGFLLIDTDTLTTPVADTYVRIFDANGNELLHSDDDLATGLNGEPVEFNVGGGLAENADGSAAGHTTDSFIAASVTAGDVYYIAVCNFANRNFDPNTLTGRVTSGSTGEYSLFVSLRNRDFNGAIPQAVTTASLPLVNAPGTIGVDGTPDGLVDVGDRDVDFIRINSPTAGILEVNIDSMADAPDITDSVDTVLRLFDENGNLLAVNDDDSSSLDPLIRYEIDANTNYFAAVAGYGNSTFDPFILGSGGSGDTGDYNFNIQVLPQAQAAALSNDVASDGQVQALALAQQVTGDIGDDDGFVRGDTDVDLYTFTAPFSGQFTFTAGPSDEFGCDTFLRLFTSDGNQIAEDDNGQGGTGGSKITATLTAGQSYLVGVNGSGPNADSYDPITGANAGSGSTGGYVLQATAGQRSISFGGKTKAVFNDADGSRVTISVKGPGSGLVLFDTDADADPSGIVLTGVTNRSSVSVKGDTTVGGVSIDGALKSFSGKTLDLNGTFSAGGSIRTLQLRTLSDATITLGAGDSVSFSAGSVFDTSLTAAAAIKSIKVVGWFDNVAPEDAITTPLLSSVSSKGDFMANIAADSVGKVKVGGTLAGDIISTGDIASVTAASIGDVSVFAGVAPGFSGLPDTLDDFTNPLAKISSLSIKGKFTGAFSAARIAAPLIRKTSVGNVLTDNGGVAFGFAADNISSISGLFDGSEKFKFKNLADPAQSVIRNDFAIRAI